MSTLTASHPIARSLAGRPTAVDRALLRMAVALENIALSRMHRRAAAEASPAHARAEEGRRDVVATVHAGLLPR